MNVTITILIVIICICGVMLLLFKLKNRITYKHHMMLAKVIYSYHLCCISQRWTPKIHYTDMEGYKETLFRWWDWGYTRIMPENKLELIELFIKEDE